ncbi:TraK domain-containing protein [Desulfobulbus oligotrophicus]|uniref:Type-F conjugative transfer system secretin TraK n=1 Tax=Desulfobulbus oligotrophicus TaxID=1909699 RepID=A0A7T6APL3_9BACT|nr:type-F conjugative transfer system secretin TraK [Desulfobulbus oligotrophicus]QQG64668.1 type-F conjugative transfer system secretin TraK [Desulfobulbus oligotrophicus]
MKILCFSICCLLLNTDHAVAGEGVPAEVPTMVELSAREINRIVCPGQMSDLIFSEEKGLTGHFSGNNAFIKFTAEEVGGKLKYNNEPSEIYAVCNGSVFTIIGVPAEINAVTVRLALPKSETVEKNITRYKNMPLEKQALQLIKEAYDGVFPSSYQVIDKKQPVYLCPDLDLVQQQVVEIEGVGLQLKAFKATSRLGMDLELAEKTFLSAAVGNPILAVAIEQHTLKPKQSTRVFVVERKDLPVATMTTLDAGFER